MGREMMRVRCGRCDGVGLISTVRDAEGLWIPETCPECRGKGGTRALAQAQAGAGSEGQGEGA